MGYIEPHEYIWIDIERCVNPWPWNQTRWQITEVPSLSMNLYLGTADLGGKYDTEDAQVAYTRIESLLKYMKRKGDRLYQFVRDEKAGIIVRSSGTLNLLEKNLKEKVRQGWSQNNVFLALRQDKSDEPIKELENQRAAFELILEMNRIKS